MTRPPTSWARELRCTCVWDAVLDEQLSPLFGQYPWPDDFYKWAWSARLRSPYATKTQREHDDDDRNIRHVTACAALPRPACFLPYRQQSDDELDRREWCAAKPARIRGRKSSSPKGVRGRSASEPTIATRLRRLSGAAGTLVAVK